MARTNGPPPRRKTTRTTRGKALGIAWHAHGSGAASRQGWFALSGPAATADTSPDAPGKGHARCQTLPLDTQVLSGTRRNEPKALPCRSLRSARQLGSACFALRSTANAVDSAEPECGDGATVQPADCCFRAAARNVCARNWASPLVPGSLFLTRSRGAAKKARRTDGKKTACPLRLPSGSA